MFTIGTYTCLDILLHTIIENVDKQEQNHAYFDMPFHLDIIQCNN